MTTPKRQGLGPWRIVKPLIKPLLPVCYKVFPASKNLKRYRDTFGRLPNVVRPRTFNERIQRKILFDRNPRMALFADKLRVREYVKSRLGDDRFLTKLYAVVTSAAEIGQLSLPARFVMKPNHASGMVKIVTDPTRILPGELESLAAEWLRINYYDVTQEWAYKNIERRVMFEELLEVDGVIPPDFKFYCFGGEPRFIHVAKDRLGELKVNLYDLNLSLLPVKSGMLDNFRGEMGAPPNFNRMLEAARRLSAGTDFLRVDLYNVNGRIVFGELTNYPSNGRTRFQPPEWDLKYGSYWR
jgi:hypothetical protein